MRPCEDGSWSARARPRSQLSAQDPAYTGDTWIVPLPQGAMASWKVGDAVVAPGIVTLADSEVGQLVSEPTGTSENW